MWKIISMLPLLVACSPKIVYVEKEPISYPWPPPVTACCELNSLKVTEEAKVEVSWEDYQKLSLHSQDMFRYIKDISSMVCLHQPKDEKCIK